MAAGAKWIEGLPADCSVADAARRSLGPRLSSVVHLLPLAAHLAEHDIEHVHRLRVATRRATAALKLYRDCVAGKPGRRMKKRLRQIRRAAGDARDLDVLADRLARDYGEPAAPVVELIANDRAAVQPAIIRVAQRCREDDCYIRKTAKLLRSIRNPKEEDSKAECESDAMQSFRDWAVIQLAGVAEKFVAAMPNDASDAAALHQFRIRAKGVRYAIELVFPAFGPELRKQLYPIVEELQERLGHVQDHVTAIARCRNWLADVRNASLHVTLEELMEAETRGLTDAIRDFHAWWTAERAEETRQLACVDRSTLP
jgi:CHAD domain-containing protein